MKVGEEYKARKSKKQIVEEMKTVLEVENKIVVNSNYLF
jgi:hypothetical protein